MYMTRFFDKSKRKVREEHDEYFKNKELKNNEKAKKEANSIFWNSVVSKIVVLLNEWDNIKSSPLSFGAEAHNLQMSLNDVKAAINRFSSEIRKRKLELVEGVRQYNENPQYHYGVRLPYHHTVDPDGWLKREKLEYIHKNIIPSIEKWLEAVETGWNEIKNKRGDTETSVLVETLDEIINMIVENDKNGEWDLFLAWNYIKERYSDKVFKSFEIYPDIFLSEEEEEINRSKGGGKKSTKKRKPKRRNTKRKKVKRKTLKRKVKQLKKNKSKRRR